MSLFLFLLWFQQVGTLFSCFCYFSFMKSLIQFILPPYIFHRWEIRYFQTHVFSVLSHSLKGCPECHSILLFCWDIDMPSPPELMLSLFIMESLTLAETAFLEGGLRKHVHYHTNKPCAHSNHLHSWRPMALWLWSRGMNYIMLSLTHGQVVLDFFIILLMHAFIILSTSWWSPCLAYVEILWVNSSTYKSTPPNVVIYSTYFKVNKILLI